MPLEHPHDFYEPDMRETIERLYHRDMAKHQIEKYRMLMHFKRRLLDMIDCEVSRGLNASDADFAVAKEMRKAKRDVKDDNQRKKAQLMRMRQGQYDALEDWIAHTESHDEPHTALIKGNA